MIDLKALWLLCAGLLLAGTVEAGESAQCEYVLVSGHLRNSCELLEIDPGVNPYLHDAPYMACYQRMREAMRMVNEGMYLSVPRGERPSQWLLPIPNGKADSWDAVMKDCVQ